MIIFSDAESCWVFFLFFYAMRINKEQGGGKGKNQHLEEFVPLMGRFNGILLPKQKWG